MEANDMGASGVSMPTSGLLHAYSDADDSSSDLEVA